MSYRSNSKWTSIISVAGWNSFTGGRSAIPPPERPARVTP
jgi:hypothetical protein